MSQKSSMHVGRESDGRVLPAKCLNKDGKPSAEGAEGRRSAEENSEQTTAAQTQGWGNALSGLRRVREAAKKDKRLQFTALLHHVSVPLLLDSFYALKREAAPGVDGVTWKEYETDLDKRLEDLYSRVHRGAYRAQPSKRAYIPKEDGRQRPLGIAALERTKSFSTPWERSSIRSTRRTFWGSPTDFAQDAANMMHWMRYGSGSCGRR